MNIDELINKCLIGEEHLEQAEYEQVGNLLIELKTLRKAYELMARDFALKNYCIVSATCFDSCTEEDRKKCHSKEWIMEDYFEVAQNGKS